MKSLKVVVFSGGRGSTAVTRKLVADNRIELTLAVNGYDDGKSTGEVRRFLGECLGPSDFRKTAASLASARRSCPAELLSLLDYRFPEPCDQKTAEGMLDQIAPGADAGTDEVARDAGIFPDETRAALRQTLDAFRAELDRSGCEFPFADCAIGNLVFAGCFLLAGRDFLAAVDRYVDLVGLPPGLILNVTDGSNAHLVAVDRSGHLLATEADIVDAGRRNHIDEIYLLAEPPDEQLDIGTLAGRDLTPEPNPLLLERLEQADLIIYSPGTQHSSLFPSYLTRGVGRAIAHNVTATKILVTNIQEDAEIPDANAVELVERALHYLRMKGKLAAAAPSLITHYVINDPGGSNADTPYVPLGSVQSFEDPRLVRIANYELGVSGRHDGARVLEPFIDTLLARGSEQRRVAVLLLDTDSTDKVVQTVLEAVRAGIAHGRIAATFLYASDDDVSADLCDALPVRVANVRQPGRSDDAGFREHVDRDSDGDGGFDYVALFNSSGMYRGEDLVDLLTPLAAGRIDAAWGSRRLFRQDVRESYRLRYQRAPLIGAISYVGSHVLSIVTLVLYGRYVTDTLSGSRAVRTSLFRRLECAVDDMTLNHQLLVLVLREGSEFFETPVHFFSMSPDKANRFDLATGLRGLWRLVSRRFVRP